MGRFTSKTTKDSAATEAAKSEEITQEGVEMTEEIVDDFPLDDAVDIPEDADEAPEVSAEDSEPEAVPDISGFMELVASLIEKDDSGDVTEVPADAMLNVQQAFKTLTRKEKNLAKTALAEAMEKAITEEEDLSLAKFYLEISTTGVIAPKIKKEPKEKKPVDLTEITAKHIAKLDLARALVDFGDLDEEVVKAKAAEFFAVGAEDSQKDEPELIWVKQAKSLALPKRTYNKAVSDGSRTRHSVGNHIAEAFENAESGESLTLDEIVTFKSQEYGEDSPSRQAVLAHLSSKKFKAAAALSVEEDESGAPVLTKK